MYPRRAYNPIVRVDFGSVKTPGVVYVNFFGVPGVSRRFYSCFLLTEFIFDPHNGSVDEQRGRENRHTPIEKVSRPHLRPPFMHFYAPRNRISSVFMRLRVEI